MPKYILAILIMAFSFIDLHATDAFKVNLTNIDPLSTQSQNSSVFTSEKVPGANCICRANDGCVNITSRKYECFISNSSATPKYSPSSIIQDLTNNSTQQTLIVIAGIIIILYFLPTIIVLINSNRAHTVATIFINVFLGWSIIGWFMALFLSLQRDIIPVQVIERKG